MSKNKIGILGCGWLGLPLAKSLLEKGYFVSGTTTSSEKMEELRALDILPFQISLLPHAIEGNIQGFLSQTDTLIINVPPRLRGSQRESYVDKMQLLLKEIEKNKPKQIVFVSSTAVYGDAAGKVTETTIPTPTTESGKQLLVCEQLFQKAPDLKTTIIRFGGLIGPMRHPITMLSGKQNLSNGNAPINLIHLEDCIHMIITIIEKEYWGETFNGVYPQHPSKSEYYTLEANKRGLEPPQYSKENDEGSNKIVLSQNYLDKGHVFTTAILT
ncbi:SDR family oxidoreductase [Allomuricauda sp. NBRC 101325]|uniref:SDR family oxidoreductase n=1 Tax=Allomuricauda sp. NBRC 101325 TaxID=1113758 RepID=UPI0024A06727|nr:SDR family oxidoreductase [Muricauda sp. NBRC 101325]GLU42955.1 epimerase [Muricauda sp. NBRC 101325]